MSKNTKYILGGFVTIVLVLFITLTLSLDYLVKSGIESTGTDMTGTAVTVDGVSLSPFSGEGTIDGLRVRNPDGFESEYAVVIENLDISVNIRSLLSDTVLVNDIQITKPAISVIQKVPENNLRILLNNMESATASESESASPHMVINSLLVTEGSVTVTPSIGAQPSATVSMEQIELQGVGRSGSDTSREVVRQVASEVIGEALQSALSGQLDELKEKAKDAVKDIFN